MTAAHEKAESRAGRPAQKAGPPGRCRLARAPFPHPLHLD